MEIIEKYIAEDNWKSARKEIKKLLKNNSGDHWLLTRLALTYYEERQYEKALEFSKKAIKSSPNCPLVLWDYAGALDMLGNEKEAINVFKKIIRKGIENLAFGECGEGIGQARAMLADCHYRIAHCYNDLNNKKMAIKYFEKHFALRRRGVQTIYKLNEVKKEYKEIMDAI